MWNTKTEKNFNPGLMLISLSRTGPWCSENLHWGWKVNHWIPLLHVQHLSFEVDETQVTRAFLFCSIHHHLPILKITVHWQHYRLNWLDFKHNICVCSHLKSTNTAIRNLVSDVTNGNKYIYVGTTTSCKQSLIQLTFQIKLLWNFW